MNEQIQRPSLIDVLEGRLRNDILSGRYPAGSYLPPERELAARYGVTRTSVKHSLVRLEQLGLIQTRHGVGSKVRHFEESAGTEILPWLVGKEGTGLLPEIFEARRLVGALVARLAAARAKVEDADQLAEELEAVAAAGDPAAVQAAELEVHRSLARMSGNRVFLFLANTLLKAYEPVSDQMTAVFSSAADTAAALAPLVAAVSARDPDAAEQAAENYLATTEGPLLAALIDPTSRTPLEFDGKAKNT